MNQISRYLNYALFVIILSFLTSSLKAQTSAIAALQTKYDTLIPIFDSFYITYARMDSAQVRDGRQFATNNSTFILGHINSLKWGIIDTTGNVVIPFIFDGIKAISKNTGVASVYRSSWSLNTGVPRYVYQGSYIIFSKEGHRVKKPKPFSKTIVGFSDNHFSDFVITRGPFFYLPSDFVPNNEH